MEQIILQLSLTYFGNDLAFLAEPKLGLIFLNIRVHTPWGLLQLTPQAKIGQLRLRFPSLHIRQDNWLPYLGDKTASGR